MKLINDVQDLLSEAPSIVLNFGLCAINTLLELTGTLVGYLDREKKV